MIRAFQPSDVAAVRELLREYAVFVGDDPGFVPSFERDLAELPGVYAPPAGCLLLGVEDGIPAGCAGLRRFDFDTGEMKRLYVRPDVQSKGLGRALTAAIIEQARAVGYRRLVLDTLPKMERAAGLYRSLGFRPIAPYGNKIPSALCFEFTL